MGTTISYLRFILVSKARPERPFISGILRFQAKDMLPFSTGSMNVYLVMGGEIARIGGLEKYVVDLAYYLSRRGFSVRIMSKMGRICVPYPKEGCSKALATQQNLHVSSPLHLFDHLPSPLTTYVGIIRLSRNLRSQNLQRSIIHVHDISSSLFIGILIRRIFRVPLVVQIHGFPLREQHIKLTKVSSVLSSLIWFFTKMCHHIALRLIMTSSAPVLVNNNEVKLFYESCISREKLRVIPAAIDLQRYQAQLMISDEAKVRLGIDVPESTIVIGYIGGLRPEKNVDVLIEAFSQLVRDHPELETSLVIIGDGPMRSSLGKLVERLEMSKHVTFKGFIPNAYRLLNAINILVLPSLSEGSPLCLLEAMASGRGIVASNIPAISEMVRNNQEALLFDPSKSEQLTTAILRLCRNAALRTKLGENARRKSVDYDVDVVFRRIVQTYWEIWKTESSKRQLFPSNLRCSAQT